MLDMPVFGSSFICAFRTTTMTVLQDNGMKLALLLLLLDLVPVAGCPGQAGVAGCPGQAGVASMSVSMSVMSITPHVPTVVQAVTKPGSQIWFPSLLRAMSVPDGDGDGPAAAARSNTASTSTAIICAFSSVSDTAHDSGTTGSTFASFDSGAKWVPVNTTLAPWLFSGVLEPSMPLGKAPTRLTAFAYEVLAGEGSGDWRPEGKLRTWTIAVSRDACHGNGHGSSAGANHNVTCTPAVGTSTSMANASTRQHVSTNITSTSTSTSTSMANISATGGSRQRCGPPSATCTANNRIAVSDPRNMTLHFPTKSPRRVAMQTANTMAMLTTGTVISLRSGGLLTTLYGTFLRQTDPGNASFDSLITIMSRTGGGISTGSTDKSAGIGGELGALPSHDANVSDWGYLSTIAGYDGAGSAFEPAGTPLACITSTNVSRAYGPNEADTIYLEDGTL